MTTATGVALRQPPAPPSTGRSWWIDAPRDNWTARGDQETQQSRHRREVAGLGMRFLQE